MQYLWAPWRMEYIDHIASHECFFCEYLRATDDARNLVLHRGAHSLVVMNRFPYNGGHLMVAPTRHVATLAEMTDGEMLDLVRLTRDMMELLKRALGAENFNVGTNIGRVAGAGLADHIHVHIVPRWAGDTNFMPVVGDTKVIPVALAEMYQRLRAASLPQKEA